MSRYDAMTPEFVKTLVIDLDGPLYEFDKTMRYMLREERHCKGLQLPSTDWLLPNQDWHTVTDEDWDWLWTEGVRLGLFRHGHVTKHAVRAMHKLRDAGFTLKVLTHRPMTPRASRDTHEWITFHFPGVFAETLMTDVSKAKFERGYLLIDDKPQNVLEWRETSRPAILFGRPWNDSPERHRLDGWYPILDRLGVAR